MSAPAPVPVLPDTARVTLYAPAASAGPFSVGFAIYGDSSDYTNWINVSLNGVDQTGAWVMDSPSGSLLTLARPITDARITFTNPITGNLVITGAQRPRRLAQLSENQGVTARNFNQLYTAVVAMLREAWDLRARTLLFPPGETAGVLPTVAQRINQFLGFDSLGNFIAAQPSSALVSSAMQPVVAAGSTAAALALLGAAPANAITPIGLEAPFSGLVVPPLWLPEDGTTRLRAGFPELLAVIAPTFQLSHTTGFSTATLLAGSTTGWGAPGTNPGWPIEGSGFAPGTTIIGIIDAATVQLNAPAIGDGVSAQIFPYGNGDGSTTFTLPNMSGRVPVGIDIAGAVIDAATGIGFKPGAERVTLVTNNLPPYTPFGTNSTPTVNVAGGSNLIVNAAGAAGLGGGPTGNLSNVSASLSGAPVFTGTAQGGTSTPFSIVQPSSVRKFIIYAGR